MSPFRTLGNVRHSGTLWAVLVDGTLFHQTVSGRRTFITFVTLGAEFALDHVVEISSIGESALFTWNHS